MKPRRDSKPSALGSGTESFGIADAGEPIYKTPAPPVKTVLRHGAGGTLEVVAGGRPQPAAPEARPRSGVPDLLIPTAAELRSLPRWAGLLFAARCARRVWPLAQAEGPTVAEDRAARAALDAVELRAAGGEGAARAMKAARDAVRKVTLTRRLGGEAAAAVFTTWDLVWAADTYPDLLLNFWLPVDHAARALMLAATVATPLARQLRCIRRDFDRLARLAKEHGWTDDTPVPPDVFGPLWPKSLTPPWATEPPPPG